MPNRTPARPIYSLKEVKRLASENKVDFSDRRDGGADLNALGMTRQTACAIITQLQPRDYNGPSYKGECPADVYLVQRPMLSKPLYIKLQIDADGELLIVISFHLSN